MHLHIIEDNIGDIILEKELFEEIDPSIFITVSTNGMEAIDFLVNSKTDMPQNLPDGILLDLNMPVMNGLQFLDTTKEWNSVRNIPIVILTSSSAPSDIQQAYRNNCTAFFTKPSDIEETKELLELIVDFIRLRKN
jgi:CheY-like chemotaxis protein